MDDIDLGNALCSYTSQSSDAYDPIFDQYIREIRPDWFENKAQIKKDQLIEMAKNGDQRPNHKHPLGAVLYNYTLKHYKSYDPKFNQYIRKLRPDWFENKVQIKKDKLIKIAKNGDQRPIARKHPLGWEFIGYTSINSPSYDPIFDKTIRELRPDWFEDKVQIKKDQLIKIAKNGDQRPIRRKHPLGNALWKYTNKNNKKSYDPKFDKTIRQIRPDWFVRLDALRIARKNRS